MINDDESQYILNKKANDQIRENLMLPPEQRTDEIVEKLANLLKTLNFFKKHQTLTQQDLREIA